MVIIIQKSYVNWIKLTPLWLQKLHNLYFNDAWCDWVTPLNKNRVFKIPDKYVKYMMFNIMCLK